MTRLCAGMCEDVAEERLICGIVAIRHGSARTTMDDTEAASLIAGLSHSRSPKRRSAARRMRKTGDSRFCEALLAALVRERKDVRTWETQYQMVMALGHCGCQQSMAVLTDWMSSKIEASALYSALGDAFYRLASESPSDLAPFRRAVVAGDHRVVEGVLQGMQSVGARLTDSDVHEVIGYARSGHCSDGGTRVILTGAALWESPALRPFLEEYLDHSWNLISEAAAASLAGKYRPVKPL